MKTKMMMRVMVLTLLIGGTFANAAAPAPGPQPPVQLS